MALWWRHRRLSLLADLLGLGAVAALLAAIHVFLPPRLHAQFAFQQSLARPETLLTAAYLHIDDQHLLNNLAGYATVALYTYVLCVTAGQRRWFRLTTCALLVVAPVLVNLTSMALWGLADVGELPPSRGFSGIVAAFGGFLAVALLVSLRQSYSRVAVVYVGQVVLLVVLGELLVIYAGRPAPRSGVGHTACVWLRKLMCFVEVVVDRLSSALSELALGCSAPGSSILVGWEVKVRC